MKLLFAIVPWLLLAASAVSFVMGWEWVRVGEVHYDERWADPAFLHFGQAFRAVGFALECVGVVGALIALGLLSAGYRMSGYLRRIQALENEKDQRREAGFPATRVPKV